MKITWIEPDTIAAGSIPLGEKDIRSLHEQGIRAILTLTEHALTAQKEITPDLLTSFDMVCFHAPIDDGYPPEPPLMHAIVKFLTDMGEQKRAVYVHCHAGVGRTGTVLHGHYLAKGLSLEETQNRIKTLKLTSSFIMLSESQRKFLVDFADQNRLK